MATTTVKRRYMTKTSASDQEISHFETEAGVVLYTPSDSGLAQGVDNVSDALDAIYNLAKTGGVTGVKGGSESTYRTGNVNLTAANVGADASGTAASAVSAHNSSTTAHADIRNLITTVQTAAAAAQSKADQAYSGGESASNLAQTAYSVALGRARAVSFATVDAMTSALKAAASSTYNVGDNLFIKATGVPDYWVSGVLSTNAGTYGYYEISPLETQKVDLAPYQTKTDSTLATTAKTVAGAINEVKGNADSALTKSNASSATLTNILEGAVSVMNAESASKATKAEYLVLASGEYRSAGSSTLPVYFNGAGVPVACGASLGVSVTGGAAKLTTARTISLSGDATGSASFDGSANKAIAVTLAASGVTAGTYSAVTVDAKGRVTAGAKVVEVGASGQTTPSASLAVGGIFLQLIS